MIQSHIWYIDFARHTYLDCNIFALRNVRISSYFLKRGKVFIGGERMICNNWNFEADLSPISSFSQPHHELLSIAFKSYIFCGYSGYYAVQWLRSAFSLAQNPSRLLAGKVIFVFVCLSLIQFFVFCILYLWLRSAVSPAHYSAQWEGVQTAGQ